jgi:hypothetical protein
VWTSAIQLESDLLGELDLALIRAVRRLVAEYLTVNQDKELHGIRIFDAVVPCCSDVRFVFFSFSSLPTGSICSKISNLLLC